MALVVLPTLCWIIAAIAGRWFCAKAIAPVRRMAEQAGAIRPADTQARLPAGDGADELSELAESFKSVVGSLVRGVRTATRFRRRRRASTPHTANGHAGASRGRVKTCARSSDEYVSTLRVVDDELRGLDGPWNRCCSWPADAGETPTTRVIDVAEWLRRYLAKWNHDSRHVDVRIDATANLELRTNPDLLEQLLDVLLGNALKYSPAGTTVTLRARRDGRQTSLEVEDRGPGIPADEVAAVFQPFYRARARDVRDNPAPVWVWRSPRESRRR
ncbi:MAG: ATP-binding protein [Pirellulales bacterium]